MKHMAIALVVGLALCCAVEAQIPAPSGTYTVIGNNGGTFTFDSSIPLAWWIPDPAKASLQNFDMDEGWWDHEEGYGFLTDQGGNWWEVVHSHGDWYDVYPPHPSYGEPFTLYKPGPLARREL